MVAIIDLAVELSTTEFPSDYVSDAIAEASLFVLIATGAATMYSLPSYSLSAYILRKGSAPAWVRPLIYAVLGTVAAAPYWLLLVVAGDESGWPTLRAAVLASILFAFHLATHNLKRQDGDQGQGGMPD